MTGGNVLRRLALLILTAGVVCPANLSQARSCKPTPHDEIGPFYRQNAPVRNRIGSGYLLRGKVLDTECRPIPSARVEIWQAGPNGEYGDQFRATLYPDKRGRYRFETFMPPPYLNRPPHIHILVDAKGYAGLITQHYPQKGKKKARFDLVLERE
jgi:protocatechuate 3,4-dioxygenase beta subunit